MRRYLGVDGGGSKTAFALIDSSGQVLARAIGSASYYFTAGFEAVENVLRQGITSICEQACLTTVDIDQAFFGLPGYGEASADLAWLDLLPQQLLGHLRYSCDNDMICAWAGSLAGADGINVISGTGSMTYGQWQGRGRRVGGWGELFGDEGSAYWVAAQALNAFTRMSDGRLPRTALYPLMRERLGVSHDLDVINLVIDKWGGDRAAIAALATTVGEAARRHDSTADDILGTAATELVTLVETTRTLIGCPDQESVPVSYSGGMFSDAEFRERFARTLRRVQANYELRTPLLDPALGAAVYAAQCAGTPLSVRSLHELATVPTRFDEVTAP